MTKSSSVVALLAIFCAFSCSNFNSDTHTFEEGEENEGERLEQRFKDALEEEFNRTYDPQLGYVPKERLYTALQEAKRLQREIAQRRSVEDLQPRFQERGPIDIGGRTRAIHIDLSDPERKKVWSGSVAGGLYVTDNITASPVQWRTADDYLDNLAISSIVQDPNDHNIMYMGTGEGFNNIDAVRGLGIFKSEDGGETWRLLESTTTDIFSYTRAMAIDEETGYVYAATRNGGVRRSEDGGVTWVKVLGINLSAGDDRTYDVLYADGNLYASTTTDVYMSENGDRGNWIEISRPGSGFPSSWSRNEITVCKTDGSILYAIGASGGGSSDVYKTTNMGETWTSIGSPGGGDITNGQVWYDLDIAVDPFNCNRVIAAGVPLWMTTSGSNSWSLLPHSSYQSNQGHVDQHKVFFDDEQQGVVYFGNDGGIWRSSDGNAQIIEDKNFGYVTAQYYGCAIHPDSFSNFMLGGTQDNGSHKLNEIGVARGENVRGGDGFFCHIDQKDPNYMMASSQGGSWGLSTNGGLDFSSGLNVNGGFITPSDYDNDAGILYSQTFDASFYRWHVRDGGWSETVTVDGGVFGGVSTIAADPNTDNRIYIGTNGGRVYQIDSANVGAVVSAKIIFTDNNRTISSIALANGNPDEIIVTMSNYGISNSVIVSRDGGATWESCEGNLPDMPVRWGIFSPLDSREALIATEAGVWATSDLNGTATIWNPPLPGGGTPLVRTDQLDWRASDNVIIAGTHGRGLWTSTVFSEARARFVAPQVHYENSPLQFLGEVSVNAESYDWDFGDGTTSTDENPVHSYSSIGTYDVSLTINGSLTTNSTVKILPRVALPYIKDGNAYGGSFEGFEEQIGIEHFNGSSFEVGSSTFIGKNGTKTGSNAVVLDPTNQYYEPNTATSVYLPEFDFSEESIYTFSFWANYFLDQKDGFIVEYSTDAGRTWNILGRQEQGWYTANGSLLENSAWPNSTPYFTKEVAAYTRYSQDITFLSGQPSVAFRFQFRSEGTGLHPGMALDDIEVTKYEGELQTNVTTFDGEFVGGNRNIEIEWSTRPEYYCQTFELYRSTNGRDFDLINTQACNGVITDRKLDYKFVDDQGGSVYFYKLKVINYDGDGYEYEFFTETISVRRDNVEPGQILNAGGPRIFPNPFRDAIYVTFTSNLQQNVRFEIYDETGRLVHDREAFVDDVYAMVDLPDLAAAVYYLSIQIADGERKVFPMAKAP